MRLRKISKNPSSCLHHFSPFTVCAVIWVKRCSRNNTLFTASSPSHYYTPYTCLNCFPGNCGKKQTMRGPAYAKFFAWWLLVIKFPGRNQLIFPPACGLWGHLVVRGVQEWQYGWLTTLEAFLVFFYLWVYITQNTIRIHFKDIWPFQCFILLIYMMWAQ